MTDLDYFRDFVNVSQGADYYTKWIAANSKLAPLWFGFRDDILAGKRPTPPDMGNNKYGGGLVKAGVMYLGLTALSPTPTPPAPTPPSPDISVLSEQWWAPDSPWNTPASAFVVHPQSATWMSFVKSKLTAPGFLWVNAKAWTPVIHSVLVGRDAGWGYHDNYGWNRAWRLKGVPLNPNMITPVDINSTVTDNAVYIFDEATEIWYCVAFTPGRQPNGDWDAGNGGSLGAGHFKGSGFWDNGKNLITAAGGGSLDAGGMVHLHELQAGRIPHALKCSLPNPTHRGPFNVSNAGSPSRVMLPATRSDGGAGDNTSAPPYGCRYQLDPAFDVNAYSTDPHMRVFLKCLQEFGMIDTDSTGSNMFSLYGSSPQAPGFPFRPGSQFNGVSTLYDHGISGIVDHLRILSPPASVALESPSAFDSSRWVNG